MRSLVAWLPVVIIATVCLTLIAMTWIAGNLKVDGRKCDYVRINYAWQISARGCE